ncbi:MAG: lactoylglutathione lyase [Pseudomonadota bacterium]
MRMLYTMLRVANLERSIQFYTTQLGMTLFRTEAYPSGRFTLAFVGYGEEGTSVTIELTHNWDRDSYDHGTAHGHIALSVVDLMATCEMLKLAGVTVLRPAGPMSFDSPDRAQSEFIAFIEDPDHYKIELVELQ